MKKYVRQIILPLLAAAIWGAAFLAQGNLSNVLPPFFINFSRCMVAVVALLLVDFGFTAYKKSKQIEAERADVKKLILGGLCCGLSLCGAINVQQIGIGGTSSGEAAFVTTLYMILVPVFGVFLKRKASVNIWISVGMAVIGLALICQVQTATINVSYLYLIASAFFFAVQILFVDYFVRFVDGVKLSCAQFLVAGVVSGIISLFSEKVDFTNMSQAILPLLYLGIFSSAVGYTLQIIAQKDTNPTIVSILLSMESAFALLFGVISCLITSTPIKEEPLQFLGCFLMLCAVVLSQVNPFKSRSNNANNDKKEDKNA